MDKISEHITLREATRTSVHMQNVPDHVQKCAMIQLAERIFEPLRGFINEPIYINSFFRSQEVNKAVGGAFNSQHTRGEAIDIRCNRRNAEMFNYIRENLPFDQLIWEFGTDTEPAWVHVSYKIAGNRKQVLKATKVNGRTKYIRL